MRSVRLFLSLTALTVGFSSCVIPGWGSGSISRRLKLQKPVGADGIMYYQNEQLGVDEVCVQTEPSLRHDTGFIFSENQILSVTNEPAGSYRLRARGARDATEEEQTISPWWTDYDPYIVRAKAVEVLFLMASPTQAQVFADPTFRDKALKAMNRAAARSAAGLDTAPWIPGDAFIPAWLVERMAASGLAPLGACRAFDRRIYLRRKAR